jgi:proteasome activator subunit 4
MYFSILFHILTIIPASLPTIFVYSIALDGPIASLEPGKDDTGYVAGSKALTSLRTIISSIETYFHPSNHGNWSANVRSLLRYKVSKRGFR